MQICQIKVRKVFREMFDLIMEGKEINHETIETKKALKKAIDKWGIFERPTTPYDGLFTKWSRPKVS